MSRRFDGGGHRRRLDGAGMSTRVRQRRLDDLVLQLKGLVHVRALLETQGASRAELAAHSNEIARVRAELAGVAQADATARGGHR